MDSISDDLFKHIALSVALPELFYSFRVYTKDNFESENVNSYSYEEIFLNNLKIDKLHFDKIVKMYNLFSHEGNVKISFEELIERMKNKHFENVDNFVKVVYDLIIDNYIIFSEVYNEENYVSINLERFVVEGKFDWEKFGEVVSIVTIILDNLLTTYFVPTPSRQINLNFIGLEKINLNENEIKKLNEYIHFYTIKTSMDLAKQRGKNTLPISLDFEKTNEFNWNVLISEVKMNGLRNEILFSIKKIEIVEVESELMEPEHEMDYYFSRPKKLKTIDDEDLAPVIKGMKGAKEMCPVCFSYNVTYEAGVMCCNDCGWSACSLC